MRDTIQLTRSTAHLQPRDVAVRVAAVIRNLQSTLELENEWHDQQSTVKFWSETGLAKGVQGTLQIGAGSLTLTICLPMMLRVQATTIEKQVSKVFDEALS